MSPTSFTACVYTLARKGLIDEALDCVVSTFDDWQEAGDTASVNAALWIIDVEDFGVCCAVAVLAATLRHTSIERDGYYMRVEEFLLREHPLRREQLLRGLNNG